jgi:outer membrane protein OmpA-like peptidoglycan-associated protein
MSFNPIESVKAVFPGEMLNKMAGILGESTTNVHQAMQGIIPSVMIGIILKTEFADVFDTLNLSKEAAKIEIPFNQTSVAWWWSTNYKGADYLKSLFGGKISDLTNAISSYAGISSKSASSLLNVVAPAAYSVLGRHVIASGMNVKELGTFLNSEKKKTLDTIPAGIFLEGIMGFENVGTETQTVREKLKLNWVIPVALIAVAAGVVWYFLIRQPPAVLSSVPAVQRTVPAKDATVPAKDATVPAKDATVPAKDATVPAKDAIAATPIPDVRYSAKLPGGKLLYVKKGSMEDQLASFFNDPISKPSRRFLFNFDQVKFNTGTAIITKESMTQIENVAAILIFFPNARIKIAGFNERGYDSLLNSELSENRAEAIAKALKTAGVNKGQIAGFEGFGSDFAQYASDAPDSLRAKDNRIAISVRAK